MSSLYFSLKNLATFFAHRCHYHYRFLLLSLGCHPTPFLPFRPRFSTILCKFAHKKIFPSGVTPGGCHPERSLPLVTPLVLSKWKQESQKETDKNEQQSSVHVLFTLSAPQFHRVLCLSRDLGWTGPGIRSG